jgi:creatinine amidohydrolase/Fe(II)-dependent formamide hydrolase-like protein
VLSVVSIAYENISRITQEKIMIKVLKIAVGCLLPLVATAQTPDTVFLEELTWSEVRSAIDSGTTTVIVPTAGTEQNGPHVVLGKHKYRMNAGAERIARELGNVLVAPVMTYVPEGPIDPPDGHMRFAGTISIPQDVFQAVLENTARSLKVHGFTDILLIGDSGPNQPGMQAVSEKLNQEWQVERTRVHHISDWYGNGKFSEYLRSQGYTDAQIGRHAGLSDTASLIYVAPNHVRMNLLAPGEGMGVNGVDGDPSDATAELGKIGFEMNVEVALEQIRELISR